MGRNILSNQWQSGGAVISARCFRHQTTPWFCLISFESYYLRLKVFRYSKLMFLKDLLYLALRAILSCHYWNSPPVFKFHLYFHVVPKGKLGLSAIVCSLSRCVVVLGWHVWCVCFCRVAILPLRCELVPAPVFWISPKSFQTGRKPRMGRCFAGDSAASAEADLSALMLNQASGCLWAAKLSLVAWRAFSSALNWWKSQSLSFL